MEKKYHREISSDRLDQQWKKSEKDRKLAIAIANYEMYLALREYRTKRAEQKAQQYNSDRKYIG